MTFGVQTFDASGGLVWDSSVAVGGIVADSRQVASGVSTTFTYPAYAGRTPFLIGLLDTTPASITVDTTLGYPRVSVASAGIARRFILAVL